MDNGVINESQSGVNGIKKKGLRKSDWIMNEWITVRQWSYSKNIMLIIN
jgi:hypothetical protein